MGGNIFRLSFSYWVSGLGKAKHAAALRNGLNMHAELSHFAIPLCTDPDEGTVEMISWPFLLPSTMDS